MTHGAGLAYRAGMTAARSALLLAAILLTTPALAEDAAGPSPEPRKGPVATLDLSLGFGKGNSTGTEEGQLSFGVHLSGRSGPVVIAGSAEVADNVIGSTHAFLTGGVGTWRQLETGRIVLVGLGGVHRLRVDPLFGDGVDRQLPVVGARAAWELDAGRWVMGRASLAASGYVDLAREYDANAGGDVGGFTLLLSVALGLGG